MMDSKTGDKGSSTCDQRSQSGHGKHPDWYQDLDETQVHMFRDVFELLDRDGGGSLNSAEICHAMKDLDLDVSLPEIEAVLKELDKDGNGEIDFNEFLYAMAETDKYLDMLSEDPEKARRVETQGGFTKRQRLFFSAITNFAMKHSIGEIERYYANKVRQAPHVIGFYAAGVRLIGLNDKQLEAKWKEMQRAAKNHHSPYAKPLPFVTPKPGQKKLKGPKKGKCKPPPATEITTMPPSNQQKVVSFPSRHEEHVEFDSPKLTSETEVGMIKDDDKMPPLPSDSEVTIGFTSSTRKRRRTALLHENEDITELLNILENMAKKGSVLAKLPDVHLVPRIRDKIGNMKDSCKNGHNGKPTRGDLQHRNGNRPQTTGKKTNQNKPRGWIAPRFAHNVPMPVIPMTRHESYTIEDVPEIRRVVSSTLNEYYSSLKKAHVYSAYDQWEHLNVDTIRSKKLRDNFRKVCHAYSPHKEEDVFVICPWIPGPRYTSRQPGKPQNNLMESLPKQLYTCAAPGKLGKTSNKGQSASRPASHKRNSRPGTGQSHSRASSRN